MSYLPGAFGALSGFFGNRVTWLCAASIVVLWVFVKSDVCNLITSENGPSYKANSLMPEFQNSI